MSDGINWSVLKELSEPFPANAIEQREGAFGKMLDYVATETVIRRLNRVAGEWSFRMTAHEWTEPISYTDKNGKPRTNRTLIVWGELTIPSLGIRTGTGVQVIDDSRSGEDLIKGALSDSLKNAAKHFGVGIDLYGPDLEAGGLLQSAPNLPPRGRTTSVNTIPAEPPALPGWTTFWNAARVEGLKDKASAEKALGDLGHDPEYAMERLAAWAHDRAAQVVLA